MANVTLITSRKLPQSVFRFLLSKNNRNHFAVNRDYLIWIKIHCSVLCNLCEVIDI